MTVVRSERFPGWTLPLVGGTLVALVAVLWYTSALWYFNGYRHRSSEGGAGAAHVAAAARYLTTTLPVIPRLRWARSLRLSGFWVLVVPFSLLDSCSRVDGYRPAATEVHVARHEPAGE